jgi:hypothetical protein
MAASRIPRPAILDPVCGNVLVVGDAAGQVEVENQGAMACGYQAGNAVFKELEGEGGFKQYSEWWQNSFEFNNPKGYHKPTAGGTVFQLFKTIGTFPGDEIDYLFCLIENDTLEGAINQYRVPQILLTGILKHKDTIKKEKPELYEKIRTLFKLE